MLLKELEGARGNLAGMGTDPEVSSSDDIASSAEVITSKLVTFRSVLL